MWTHENRAKYNRDHLRYPSDLTDDEWRHIEPFIPPAKPGGVHPLLNTSGLDRLNTVISPARWYKNSITPAE
jgi:transposase